MKNEVTPLKIKSWGKEVVQIESQTVAQMEIYVCSDDFVLACELILNIKGKVVVTGIGKSGHIGRKIAATLASTGTPAFFVHPSEANHGDLGMLTKDDLIITISNSGQAQEILSLYPIIKRQSIPIICITGDVDSQMSTMADVTLCIKVTKEACPLGLTPTSSTVATLVMGDALAISLLQARGFTAEDFALSHPGGKLGRTLLLHIFDIMHTKDDIPKVHLDTTILDTLYEITNKRLGITAVINDNEELVGVFTDGDLRRVLSKNSDLNIHIKEVMTKNCVTLSKNILVTETLSLMSTKKINSIFIVDVQKKPIGVVNMLDIVKAGVM